MFHPPSARSWPVTRNSVVVSLMASPQHLISTWSADPEVGMFICATDNETWVRLVALGVTSLRKLVDYVGTTDASAWSEGMPAGLPCTVVLKRALFNCVTNWRHDFGLRLNIEIEAALACVCHTARTTD
jgi:hypothetical protein